MIGIGAGHDAHRHPSMQGGQRRLDAIERCDPLRKPLRVARVAFAAQAFDFGIAGGRAEGLEDAAPLPQPNVDVLRRAQCDPGLRQHVSCRLEVELLGVDQHAVVVPEDRLEHRYAVIDCTATPDNALRSTTVYQPPVHVLVHVLVLERSYSKAYEMSTNIGVRARRRVRVRGVEPQPKPAYCWPARFTWSSLTAREACCPRDIDPPGAISPCERRNHDVSRHVVLVEDPPGRRQLR